MVVDSKIDSKFSMDELGVAEMQNLKDFLFISDPSKVIESHINLTVNNSLTDYRDEYTLKRSNPPQIEVSKTVDFNGVRPNSIVRIRLDNTYDINSDYETLLGNLSMQLGSNSNLNLQLLELRINSTITNAG